VQNAVASLILGRLHTHEISNLIHLKNYSKWWEANVTQLQNVSFLKQEKQLF